nr:DNA/RNA non-specific endonuclease [Deltaproteobacteria bacterium]
VDVGGGDSRGDNKPSDTTLSARTYARGMNTRYHWLRGQWLDVRYDWTHLFGLGIGGSNDDDNIVAATHWANGEMLAIENWISSNHWRNDLYIWVNATLAWGSAHLAEAIYYYVYNGDQRIYYRSIDARRVVALTKRERSGIADALDRGLRKTL